MPLSNMEIPTFYGTAEEIIQKSIDWAETNLIPKINFNNTIKLGKRTVKEIMESKEIFQVMPCIDKAAVYALILSRNGFEINAVTERILFGKNPTGLHFTIIAKKGEKEFLLDPRIGQTTIFSPTKETFRTRPTSISFDGENEISFMKVKEHQPTGDLTLLNPFQIMGIKNRREFLKLSKTPKTRYLKFILSRAKYHPPLHIQHVYARLQQHTPMQLHRKKTLHLAKIHLTR